MLTSKQRAILRGKANTMDPVFIVGKGEIDETMIQGVKDCLDARELIKLKVLESSMYNARSRHRWLLSSWQRPPVPTACRSSAPNSCSICRRRRTAPTLTC